MPSYWGVMTVYFPFFDKFNRRSKSFRVNIIVSVMRKNFLSVNDQHISTNSYVQGISLTVYSCLLNRHKYGVCLTKMYWLFQGSATDLLSSIRALVYRCLSGKNFDGGSFERIVCLNVFKLISSC